MADGQKEFLSKEFIFELRTGSEKAFAVLFDQYAGQIYRYSRRFGLSHEDSEGIIQDVFIKIWQKRCDLDPDRGVNAYLYKVAKSYIIKKKKSLLLEKVFTHLDNLDTNGVQVDDPERSLLINDLLSLVFRWAKSLPKGQREVFELRNKEHLSMDEIAERLNISKRKAENRIYQANKTLRSKVATDKLLLLAGTGLTVFL
ncbi:RNA polymerase sigma factor [Lunatimonas salinarum]|uniref:RNA polymerase sigma factor n=1 Tax=Lunatimonas salinarum TaxID=1774590 RepID=UPI001ADF63A2|nr:sigma-70 family RNA polymerase sigma factor [Lunatimonas salinarum]